MQVSLKLFLQSGRLNQLQVGMTEEQIIELCGSPEMVGGTSPYYSRPTIFKFGNLETHFSYFLPRICTTLFVDYETNLAHLEMPASFDVQEWDLSRNADRDEVEVYLHQNEIEYEIYSQSGDMLPVIIISSSGVTISFDDDNVISAISINIDRGVPYMLV